MSSPEATMDGLLPAVAKLLRVADLAESPFFLKPLSGGANNQVYRLERTHQSPLVLKRYFFSAGDRRDRFHSEKSFYEFLQASPFPQTTPRALAWDRENRLGLFSWIEGRRLAPNEVTLEKVDQALAFYLTLNGYRHTPEAALAPEASEACFDLEQHVSCVERRLSRLAAIDLDSSTGREAADFVSDQLRPAFEKYRQSGTASRLRKEDALTRDQRCLSPSDFGFHNALYQENGALVFFDFEYAGWDDPAKFLCDFLCQPAVPIPRTLWRHCVQSLCQPIPGGTREERVAFLLPLYHLKWCCILLNEFIPRELDRRTFSQKLSAFEMDSKKREQLKKARLLFESMSQLDLVTPSI